MTRKEVRASIKMRTSGGIFVCPHIMGDIIVYEDQLVSINNKISKCRTREEAKEIIRDFGCGLDLHHADVQTPTIRKKNIRQQQRVSSQRKTIASQPARVSQPVRAVRKPLPSESSTPQTKVVLSVDSVHELE